jgi:hypothetical protein
VCVFVCVCVCVCVCVYWLVEGVLGYSGIRLFCCLSVCLSVLAIFKKNSLGTCIRFDNVLGLFLTNVSQLQVLFYEFQICFTATETVVLLLRVKIERGGWIKLDLYIYFIYLFLYFCVCSGPRDLRQDTGSSASVAVGLHLSQEPARLGKVSAIFLFFYLSIFIAHYSRVSSKCTITFTTGLTFKSSRG